MDPAKENLKRVIDDFIGDCRKNILAEKMERDSLSNEQIEFFAQRIWDLRHFALELMERETDESTWHNAVIVKQLTESEIALEDKENQSTSLIHAADETKKEHHNENLKQVIESLAKEDEMREVMMDNLVQISQELAA